MLKFKENFTQKNALQVKIVHLFCLNYCFIWVKGTTINVDINWWEEYNTYAAFIEFFFYVGK